MEQAAQPNPQYLDLSIQDVEWTDANDEIGGSLREVVPVVSTIDPDTAEAEYPAHGEPGFTDSQLVDFETGRQIMEKIGWVFDDGRSYAPDPDRLASAINYNGVDGIFTTNQDDGGYQYSPDISPGVIPATSYDSMIDHGLPIPTDSCLAIYTHDTSPSHTISRIVMGSESMKDIIGSAGTLSDTTENVPSNLEDLTGQKTTEGNNIISAVMTRKNKTDIHEFVTESLSRLIVMIGETPPDEAELTNEIVNGVKNTLSILNGTITYEVEDGDDQWGSTTISASIDNGMSDKILQGIYTGAERLGISLAMPQQRLAELINESDNICNVASGNIFSQGTT